MVESKELNVLPDSYYTAVYVCVSFLVAMLAAVLIYVICSQRYKLNWYEKTQLADIADQGEEGTPTAPKVRIGQSQSTGKLNDPNSGFWPPKTLKRQLSVCQGDLISEASTDTNTPGTPNTPLGSKISPFALSPVGGQEKGPMSPLVKYVQPGLFPSVADSATRPRVATMFGKLDHTQINATLYQKQESPDETTCEEIQGTVHFSLKYDPEFSILSVHLIQAKDLVARAFSGTADPYAKIRVLPDSKNIRQSSVHKKTLCPQFDEEFVFGILPQEIPGSILEIQIYDYDQYSRDECMGIVQVPLDEIELSEHAITLCRGITPSKDDEVKPELGELMFSLGYLPSAERLTVVIMKARNLKAMDETKMSTDAYVKVSLIQDGRRVKKKKTMTQRGTVNPVFNEALTFNVSKDMLKTISLEFTVMNDSLIGPKEVLGKILISPDSKGDEGTHLQDMLASKFAIAMWHPLVAPQAIDGQIAEN